MKLRLFTEVGNKGRVTLTTQSSMWLIDFDTKTFTRTPNNDQAIATTRAAYALEWSEAEGLNVVQRQTFRYLAAYPNPDFPGWITFELWGVDGDGMLESNFEIAKQLDCLKIIDSIH